MNDFQLKICKYVEQRERWPQNGNHILAQYDEESIIVYQAYKTLIAEQLVKFQNFHSEPCLKSGFNMNRMTWIKTNFLWMMFRSNWASNLNQERILAIRISRTGFEEILSKAVESKSKNGDKEPNKTDEVRLQWDPDHLPNGNKVPSGRRAIQLGIRQNMLHKFSQEFILSISDITDFVIENRKHILNEQELLMPQENVYTFKRTEVAKSLNLM
jgi:hypothetical protein